MNLYQHQKDALEWIKNKPKAILALDAGLGKTAITIKTFKPDENILVICPATLKTNWKQEIELWSEHSFNVHIIKKKTDQLKSGINIINYDILGKKEGKNVVPCFDFKNFRVDRVVLDESHYIKNHLAVRSKIAAKLVRIAPNAILLSGTLGEKSRDLYTPLLSIGAINKTFHEYGMMYCGAFKRYMGRREIWDYNGNSNQGMLRRVMEPSTLIMRKEDVIDLPEKIFKVVSIDVNKRYAREKDYSLKSIYESSEPIGFAGLSELLHDQALDKLPLAIKYIKDRLETTKKIVLIAKHIDVIDGLFYALKEYNPVKLDGRDNADKKDLSKVTFQTDPSCRIFIGQIKAAGVGITLTAASDVIFVETNWSFSDISQAADRCHRIGQKNTVLAEILTITDSLDEHVLRRTLEKKQFVEEVLT